MTWESNAVLFPRELLDAFLDMRLTAQEFSAEVLELFDDYPVQKVDKNSGEVLDDFDHIAWMFSVIGSTFPKSRTPDLASLQECWQLSGQSKAIIEDLFTVLEDYSSRAVINSIGGLMKSQLKNAKGDYRSLQADAARIREQQASDPLSFVDRVMKDTREKIKAMPPKTGPNANAVKKLKALTSQKIGGN